MATKTRPPILPSDPRDPTGVDRLERGAMREFSKRMRRVRWAYIDALSQIPVEPAVNRRYSFQLDQYLLQSLLVNLDIEVDSILFGGDTSNGTWLFEAYVGVAYQRGTAQEFANLAQQSPAYNAGRESLANVIQSEPYRRRIALVRARVFEEMKGLSAGVKADMSRVLTDGVGRGLNPRDIAKNLTEQAGIEERRAHRIARTEVTTALRRARWDEADEAEEEYGLTTKELHLSALSPTTRATHAARHGNLYTREQVRDWWARDGNSANCKCSTTSVLVGADGKPIVPGIQKRAKQTKEKMEARGYAWAKD
ncbi:phage head morphogenesis protein [Bordetella sp. J329]|nr:phage head morphogenesis protein [Bordetella sp. J329]